MNSVKLTTTLMDIWTDGSDLFVNHDKWYKLFQWEKVNWDGSRFEKAYGRNITGGHPYYNLKASRMGEKILIETTAYNSEGNYNSQSLWEMEQVEEPKLLEPLGTDTRPDHLKSPHLRLMPYYLGKSFALKEWMIKAINETKSKSPVFFVSKNLSQLYIWDSQILITKNKTMKISRMNVKGWYKTAFNETNPCGGLLEVL